MGTKRSSTTRDQARTRLARTRPNCHICGKPIDWDADWKDPMSFVVDHVIPLAKGGEDALSNMRAAHRQRSCNSTKRARDHAPIIRRSNTLAR